MRGNASGAGHLDSHLGPSPVSNPAVSSFSSQPRPPGRREDVQTLEGKDVQTLEGCERETTPKHSES